MPLFGKNAKLYYSATPFNGTNVANDLTWTEVTNVADLTDNFTPTEADVTTRATAAGGWEATAVVLNAGEVSFTMLVEENDTIYDAVVAAFLGQTPITMMDLTGAKTSTESIGLAANFSVALTFNKPVKGVQTADVTLKVFQYPEWVTGSATL